MLLILLTTLSAKINEVKSKTPNITNLATNCAFNAKIRLKAKHLILTTYVQLLLLLVFVIKHQIKLKIPNFSDLAKKADCDAKKHFASSDFNKFMSNTLDFIINTLILFSISTSLQNYYNVFWSSKHNLLMGI